MGLLRRCSWTTRCETPSFAGALFSSAFVFPLSFFLSLSLSVMFLRPSPLTPIFPPPLFLSHTPVPPSHPCGTQRPSAKVIYFISASYAPICDKYPLSQIGQNVDDCPMIGHFPEPCRPSAKARSQASAACPTA